MKCYVNFLDFGFCLSVIGLGLGLAAPCKLLQDPTRWFWALNSLRLHDPLISLVLLLSSS